MNRKKQIIIEVAILAALVFLFLRANSFYLSGEALLHANERGLHYGPSTEILLKHQNGTNVLVIGWIDNRNLSVIEGKKYGPLYMLRGGGITGDFGIWTEDESAVTAISRKDGVFFGLVDKEMHPECVRVVGELEIKSNGADGEPVVLEAEVQENGFFVNLDPDIRELGEHEWINVLNTYGYDAQGEQIFSNY